MYWIQIDVYGGRNGRELRATLEGPNGAVDGTCHGIDELGTLACKGFEMGQRNVLEVQWTRGAMEYMRNEEYNEQD